MDISKDLKLPSVIGRLKEYRQGWKSRVERLVDTNIPKQSLKPGIAESLRPAGRTDRGRPCEVGKGQNFFHEVKKLSLIHI